MGLLFVVFLKGREGFVPDTLLTINHKLQTANNQQK